MQEAISGVKGGVCLEERREALQKNTLAKKNLHKHNFSEVN